MLSKRLFLQRLRLFSSSSSSSPTKVPKTTTKETATVNLPQASNRETTWSAKQMPRSTGMTGPRFETVDRAKQPAPAAAIELIAQQPVIKTEQRIVACDGGNGPLGHPKIYINLVSNYNGVLD